MEERCSLCGNTELLVDAIGPEEIIRICKYCAHNNNYPVISKNDVDNIKLSERDLLRKKFNAEIGKEKPQERKMSDEELEEIVKRNLKERDYSDLVDNFHWHIQHTRRLKKLSAKQMGEAIAEPKVVIEMAEKKQLPEDYKKLVSKIEQFLGVPLFREKPVMNGIENGELDVSRVNLSEVSVDDLRRLKEENVLVETENLVGDINEDDDMAPFPKRKGIFTRIVEWWNEDDEDDSILGDVELDKETDINEL